ncbi:MAG: ATPase, partial [Eubacterium sp.]|nr:ATPase [Eubacterium sp.]
MTNTDILLEDLEDVLDDATSIPFSKKQAVDVEKIKTIIEDIRLNTPQETKQAKAIVDSRNTILEEAKKEAADIIKQAQDKADAIISESEVVKQAKLYAEKVTNEANLFASNLKTDA